MYSAVVNWCTSSSGQLQTWPSDKQPVKDIRQRICSRLWTEGTAYVVDAAIQALSVALSQRLHRVIQWRIPSASRLHDGCTDQTRSLGQRSDGKRVYSAGRLPVQQYFFLQPFTLATWRSQLGGVSAHPLTGSPPKAAMFSCTHSKASRISWVAWFPAMPALSRARKPNGPSR